jgi:AcrR family transcriptional regulator
MNDSVLTRERILEAAEDVLRRFGPAKATVVDVARVLGVSHGSVYRHFSSKAALRDAVAEQWLARLAEPLAAVVTDDSPAPTRLRRWFDLLIATKRSRALDDPELFATYVELVAESRDVVKAHVDHLVAQITRIISDGVVQGDFTVNDAATIGRMVFYATTRFHDPVHAREWTAPDIDADFEGVWLLVLGGLGASVTPP